VPEDSDLPTPVEIIEVHEEIEESYGLTYTGISSVLPEQTLENILDDIDDFDGVYLRAAGLLRRLISVHIFEDGNKRTAWTVTRLYLEDNDAEPAMRDPERVATVLRRIQRFDTHELAEWLKTGNLDEDRLEP
jgi:death-on-curing protein